MAIKRVEIFDMDGTIVNSLHRYRIDPKTGKIDLPYWIENCTPEKVSQDSLLPTAEFYKKCLADPTVYVIICTARVMSDADYNFIEENLGMPDMIKSRPLGEKRRGTILKAIQLAFLRQLRQFRDLPIHFHEDNVEYLKSVCDGLGAIGHYYPSEQGV